MKSIKFCGNVSFCDWRSSILSVTWLCCVGIVSGCTTDPVIESSDLTQQEKVVDTQSVHTEVGEASWYGPGFHGKKTANGEIFDQTKLTAAHPSLPLGTKAEVTNLNNDKKVEVTINDRGPYVDDRVIDVSRAAARKLDMDKDGIAPVKIEAKLDDKKED